MQLGNVTPISVVLWMETAIFQLDFILTFVVINSQNSVFWCYNMFS